MTNEDKAREIAQATYDKQCEQWYVITRLRDVGVPLIVAALAEKEAEIARLVQGITKHHDQGGDDRCYKDDTELYALIGLENDNSALGPEEEHIKSCRRFWRQRQCPAVAGQLQGMTIAQLEAEVERLRADNPRIG